MEGMNAPEHDAAALRRDSRAPYSRVELDDLRRALTDERDPAAADRACRLFRAAWRSMMRLHESLPDSPTFGITWNGHREERQPIARSAFPAFWAATESGVKSPIRADLVRVLVLTGLRSFDARTIEWVDIAGLDGDEPKLHRPNPKGGLCKAFTVPMSSEVARIARGRESSLKRGIRAGRNRRPSGPHSNPTPPAAELQTSPKDSP